MPASITASKFPTFEDCTSSPTCISPAPSRGFRRCGNRVNAYDRGTASVIRENILSSITTPAMRLEDADLREYAELCCCVRYHRAQVVDEHVMSELVKRWRNELIEQRRQHIVATRSSTDFSRRTLHTDNVPQSLTTDRVSGNGYRYEQAPPAPSCFESFEPPSTNSMFDAISEPLTDQDQDTRERSLYCASRTSDPGFHRIGCNPTTSLFRRTEKLQRCSGSRSTVRMDFSITTINAHRAKILLYKELQQHRREEQNCQDPHCDRKHREWFEIDLDEAKRVMGRWANWMHHAQPYDDHGRLRSPWMRFCETLDCEGTTITSEKLYRACVEGSVKDEDDDEDSDTQSSSSDEESTDEDSAHDDGEEADVAEEGSDDSSCPICLETMTSPARTTCGHEFHPECIAQAFSRDNRCPMCRAELVDGVVGGVEEAEIPMQNTFNVS